MIRKQILAAKAVLAILCASLVLTTGCGGAHAANKQETDGGEVSGNAQIETDTTSETDKETAASADDSQSAEETGAAAEVPPLEETVTDEYIQKTVHVCRENIPDGSAQADRKETSDDTAQIRFYKETPNVPYMGIREYFDLMLGGGLDVQDHDGRMYTLINAAGAEARVDDGRNTIEADNMPAFVNYYEAAKNGAASSFKDSAAPYLKLREAVYEGEPQAVSFNLGKLGIEIHGDKDDVWFPVSILSSWLSDIAQNRVMCNGNALYVCRSKSPYEIDNGYYSTEYMDSILNGGERAKDLTTYSYGELGFIFQYMYGYPGRTQLDPELLRNEGFDAALAAFGDTGRELRMDLTSRDFREFWFGMYRLSEKPLEDGHNNTTLSIGIVDAEQEKDQAFREYTWSKFDNFGISDFVKKISSANQGIFSVRPEDYMDSGYYSNGDTAIILLRAFTVDENGWNAYYKGEGGIPDDTMGTAAKGLMRAAEDGEISNVVFDLSTNPGGYSDAVAGVLSLMTGRDHLRGYDELSKQFFDVYFDVDRNLDGEFNAEDEEVSYDFNYAVMTSGASFSCGNLFPFLVREDGGMVVGDRSGGGSCSVQKAALSEGFEISISGSKFKLTDGEGSDLEQGVTPDVQLEIETRKEANEFTGEEMETLDYSAFGDLDGVCEKVSEWFTQSK